MASMAAAGLLMGGFVVSVAPSASAGTANISGTITASDTNIQDNYFLQDCAFTAYENPIQSASQSFRVTESASYSFTGVLPAGGDVYMGVFADTYSLSNCVGSFSNSLTVSLSAGQTYQLWLWLCFGSCNDDFTDSYSVDVTGPGEIVAASQVADSPPIPAWVQAYGRASADAKCEDGWDPSWQSWAEPVIGGWVCTRSIPSLG
jgi:hypothetical protein